MCKFLKAVLFDADDTLINHKECERQALKYLFNNIGVSYKEEYQSIFRPLDRKLWDDDIYNNRTVLKEDIPTYRFKCLFERINVKYDNYVKANDLFKVGLTNSIALIENSEELIRYLYNKGLILCVVTNGLIELQKPRITNSSIGNFISHIIISEEVGVHKPNPLIFHTLLKKLSIDSINTIMIGDSLEKDILGAKNANIKSIWYNPENIKNETNVLPDYEINNLLQIKNKI